MSKKVEKAITKYITFYFNSKAETIIIESYIDDIFESIYIKIISNIQKLKVQVGLLIQLWIMSLIFQKTIL